MLEANEAVSPQPSAEPAAGNLDAVISDAIATSMPDDKDPALIGSVPSTTDKGADNRDKASGRFAPKNAAKAETPVTDGSVDANAKPADQAGADPAKAQPIEPPARWSQADKEAFAKLPPEGQLILLERNKAIEGEFTRKTQELAESRKAVEPLLTEVGQWSPYLQKLGIAPEVAFRQMLTVENTLRNGTPEQKVEALALLASEYGVSLSADGTVQQADPQIQQLRSQVTQLTQALQSIQNQNQLTERQRAEHEFNSVALTKDESGNPKFPHFDRVRDSMLRLVAQGMSDTWEDAYNRSIRLDDELHQELVASERKRALEEAEKQRLEALDKAKSARPVKTSSHALSGKTTGGDLDSVIGAAIAKAGI